MSTFCPLERRAMIAAAVIIADFFRQQAQPLARDHGMTYPVALDQLMTARLLALTGTW
ncbi:MAG: hypothetical protein R2844_13870 [Caldilineales bacterium]